MHKSRIWMFFVALAGLCWGVYVPLITWGGRDLHNPFVAFLCVGAAYFLLAVLVPIGVLKRTTSGRVGTAAALSSPLWRAWPAPSALCAWSSPPSSFTGRPFTSPPSSSP